MRLSIVIICWNDRKVIGDCLASVCRETRSTDFEVIISDNGSTDDSLAFIRSNYPQARIIENGANLGFAKGNNVGIRAAEGDYILILNPDTIIHDRALDKWVEFADQHLEAGAFGCRVNNPDGSFQNPARPFPTVRRYWIAALGLRPLGHVSSAFLADLYVGWRGDSVRPIDWQSGCCVMFRGGMLKELRGFDERFFYHFEEVDLCKRVWGAGYPILYTPDSVITHLGGQSVGRFPIRFAIEKYRNRYRYIYKHHGMDEAIECRKAAVAGLLVRRLWYGLSNRVRTSEVLQNRLAMYDVVLQWNRRLDPVRFIERGEEPDVGYEPLAPAPDMLASVNEAL